jgi:hypothetical protein
MGAYLFVREGPNAGEVHRLGDDPVLVGRESTCVVRLRDPYVSRRHFRLEARGDEHWLVELGSRNTTEINGMPFEGNEYRLRKSDEILVGSTRIVFVPAAASGLPAEDDFMGMARTETFDSEAVGLELLAESPGMQRVQEHIRVVSPLDVTVLIQGESGTGKELVALALHAGSGRAGPLITVNCAAIPRDLVESELFGHEKGAFTGADKLRQGKFELANGGTLFLDEIGELPLEGQAKLLRVLETQRVTRVGGDEEREVSVRILAATNRDLHAMAKGGEFRLDLLYRLEVVKIEVPPLRDRPEDIGPLAKHFLRMFCARIGRTPLSLSDGAKACLEAHSWPGNVRELKNAIERAAIFCAGEIVGAEALQLTPADPDRSETDPALQPVSPADLTDRSTRAVWPRSTRCCASRSRARWPRPTGTRRRPPSCWGSRARASTTTWTGSTSGRGGVHPLPGSVGEGFTPSLVQ